MPEIDPALRELMLPHNRNHDSDKRKAASLKALRAAVAVLGAYGYPLQPQRPSAVQRSANNTYEHEVRGMYHDRERGLSSHMAAVYVTPGEDGFTLVTIDRNERTQHHLPGLTWDPWADEWLAPIGKDGKRPPLLHILVPWIREHYPSPVPAGAL